MTVLFYLRSQDTASIMQAIKAVDTAAEIENQGTVTLQETECYKYQVSFIFE